jgi:folylpolyglutamate synthase/dihydropteroate synthase
LEDGRELVFDGAHNVAALKRAVTHLRPSDHVLFGAQEQKDVAGMLRILEGREHVTTTAVGDAPEVLRTHPQFTADPQQALAHAVTQLGEGERLVVLGSFRLVGSLSAPYAETSSAPSEGKNSQDF